MPKKFLLLLLCTIVVTGSIYGADTEKLVVRVLGLKSSRGFVRFGLFDSEETFPKEKHVIRDGAYPINDGQCSFVIDGLAPGEYALAVGHDRNGNGKIDRFLGVPIEPVGVSGYFKRLWAVPKFEKAKFLLGSETTFIEVSVF